MQNEEVRGALLRFVDLLPILKTDGQVLRLLKEHMNPVRSFLPWRVRFGIEFALTRLIPKKIRAAAVRLGAELFARQFIAATNFQQAAEASRRLHKKGWNVTFDILGEVVTSNKLAQQYCDQLCELMRVLRQSGVTDINIAVKFSAFDSELHPVNWEGCIGKIQASFEKVLEVAEEVGAYVWVDPEKHETLELCLEVFQRTLAKEGRYGRFRRVGIGLQAYLKDAGVRAQRLLEWVGARGTPIGIRLIKGAYWDYEVMHAGEMGWEIPVYTEKWQSDACFERLTDFLLDHADSFDVAFGTHNARSVACAMAKAVEKGLREKIEFQALYGMADSLKEAIGKERYRLRVYTPFTVDNQYLPGMSYLGRRILENTSQESFLRQASGTSLDPGPLLSPPHLNRKVSVVPAVFVDDGLGGYRPCPFANFALKEVRQQIASEVTKQSIPSLRETAPDEIDRIVSTANGSFDLWKGKSVMERSDILLQAASLLEQRRFEFAAIIVNEGNKSWREADGDVVEAIEALRFAAWDIRRLEREGYLNFHESAGPTVVISPWNFPLAIPTIGVSSALAVGNTVILKPAEQTPYVANRLVQLLHEAGVPQAVLSVVVGGGRAGERLAANPAVAVIDFTGSEAVGRELYSWAWQKKVISEMGGKNAIIVSSTADLDEAVAGVVESAFGHSGQKCSACSRVIVDDDLYEEFVGKLFDAAVSLSVAPAKEPGARVVPLIDDEAKERVLEFIQKAPQAGRLLLNGAEGSFSDPRLVGPTLVVDVDPRSELAEKEIFGPVLAVFRGGRNLSRMIEMANASRYALTGGLFTRSPVEREKAIREFKVGNLYINQKITGARIGAQPFGGFKSSGVGSKTGGPDYLLQFMKTKSSTLKSWIGGDRIPGLRHEPEWEPVRRAILELWKRSDLVDEAMELLNHFPDYQLTQVQLPGQTNLLKYEPLGKGILLVDDTASAKEILMTISAALISGNQLRIRDLGKVPKGLDEIVNRFREVGIGEETLAIDPAHSIEDIQGVRFVMTVGKGITPQRLASLVRKDVTIPYLPRLVLEPVSLKDRATLEQLRCPRSICVVTSRHGHLESFW